jgi:hypothetical protein
MGISVTADLLTPPSPPPPVAVIFNRPVEFEWRGPLLDLGHLSQLRVQCRLRHDFMETRHLLRGGVIRRGGVTSVTRKYFPMLLRIWTMQAAVTHHWRPEGRVRRNQTDSEAPFVADHLPCCQASEQRSVACSFFRNLAKKRKGRIRKDQLITRRNTNPHTIPSV